MKIDAATVEKYQRILAKDPHSQVFAPLAEAYREMDMLKEAQQVVTAGVQRHPQFVGGLVTFARVHRDIHEFKKALDAAQKAASLAPENILAHQLMGEIYVSLKNPKEALRAYKMVLFLNPQSHIAQVAVQKLESITADEYDDEVFSMSKLPDVQWDGKSGAESSDDMMVAPQPSSPNRAMERMLSLIDAFIVRNDLEKAHALLKDTRVEYGSHPEIEKRLKTLQVRYNDFDEPTPLRPLQSREKLIRDKKIEVLRMMLRKIETYGSPS